MSLDDFPTRDGNSELASLSEAAFEQAIADVRQFVVQQRDRHDYGTDFQLEAKHVSGMTNFRVHVQLKATDKAANRDDSISISIARTNLNYMLSQPNSVFVCFHSATQSLLVRSAEDVFRDAEHAGEEWRSRDSLTVRFHSPFNAEFQTALHARTIATLKGQRDDRLHWIATIPEDFPDEVATNVAPIVVPESIDDAFRTLKSLYERGDDAVISKAFDQFFARLGKNKSMLIYAHLSEINLALRHNAFNRERVSDAIELIKALRPDDGADALYCRANGHSALGKSDEAKRLYTEAIRKAAGENPHLSAQCLKNLGTQFELEGSHIEARRCYEQAIESSPDLMEAHMALAISHRDAGKLEAALHHFDQVILSVDDFASTLAARGHRLEMYFRLRMADKAFDEILVILPHAHEHRWIFEWCASLVFNYARTDQSTVVRAIRFWDSYLRIRPNDRRAQRERVLCLAHAKMHDQAVPIDYQKYVAAVSTYLATDQTDAAHLWDRAGHWAQVDGNWEHAEQHYRFAYALEPDRYGYCLGTALNHLGRFEEALPILLDQATVHQPNAQSWFQVAVAQEGVRDTEGSTESYRKSLELDPDYDLAMFNLGRVHWNNGARAQAIQVWKKALVQFPSHPLAERLRQELSQFFIET